MKTKRNKRKSGQQIGESTGRRDEDSKYDSVASVAGLVRGKVHPYDDSETLRTDQQRARDKFITELFSAYLEAYRDKVESRGSYQKDLFITCIRIVWIFSIAFVLLIAASMFALGSTENISTAISVATASISFLVLIIELLKIITRYCFPENDEQYITEIVKAIQHNDLEDKKLNMEYKKATGKSNENAVKNNPLQ